MSAKFQIEGSGAGAIALIQKLNKTLDGTEEGFDKAAKGSARAEAAAKRLIDNVATPMERYKDKVDKLAEAVKKGHITQEQATVAADRYHKKMVESNPKIAEAAANQKKLKDETDRAAAAMKAQGEKLKQSLETPMERYNRQLLETGKLLRAGAIEKETFIRKSRELKLELDRATGSIKGAGESTAAAFGGKAIASLASYGAGLLSTGAIIAGVKQGLTELERQAQQTADTMMTSLGSMGELQQVSATPEEFQKNIGFARSLVRRGIVAPENQAQAADIAFALTSAGFSDQEKQILASAAERGLFKGEGLAGIGGAARKIQNLMGVEETGDLELVLDKILATSGVTQANATTTALAMTKIGAQASALGLSDEETFASLATAENVRGNIDLASTQVASFLNQVDKRGLGRGSMASIMEAIQKRMDAGESAFDIFGDAQAVGGYRALTQDPGAFGVNLDAVSKASGELRRRSGLIDTDPRLSAARLRKQQEARVAMAMEERHAERENLFNALVADIKANVGVNSAAAYDIYFRSGLADWAGSESGFMRDELANDTASGRGSRISPEVRSRVEEYLERQARAAEQSAASLKNLESRRGPATTRQE